MKPIINVQFMRAVAALAVLVYHFSFQLIHAGGSVDHWFYYAFNQIGYAGVDFFFVISGYIMWITTQVKQGNHPVLNFAYKRATRIYLGYWPYLLLALLIVALYPGLISEHTNLLGSAFLTELEPSKLVIQVAWTLQYELYFYVLFALLLLIPRVHALKAITGLIIVILAFQLYLYIQPAQTSNTKQTPLLHLILSPFCLEFFAGCLLGRFFQTQRVQYISIALLTGLALLVGAVYLQEFVLGASMIEANHVKLRIITFGAAAVLLLATVIEIEMRGRVLLKKTSTLLGGASYSIYLSHTLVITLVFAMGWQDWILQNSAAPGFWIFLLMLLTVLYSITHYIWIEKPLMSVSKRLKVRLFGSQ